MCFPKKLCDEDECKICFERTFASQEKSKFWSDKNENLKSFGLIVIKKNVVIVFTPH